MLGFLFGIHLLLGNVCLMHVAYAAEVAHAQAHREACERGGESNETIDPTEYGIREGGPCDIADCLFKQAPEPVGSFLSGDVDLSGSSGWPSVFLLQALLVIGPPQRPSDHLPGDHLSPIVRTVVLRQ